ncbi:MAG TPA: NADH-quinone oxidoreductase subunit J [Nannocystaceae bacterium]|nr:NADH-quinone oxidoreductase subunit J [Nannocystaceae bacterium]
MSGQQLVFYAFAAIAIVSAIATVSRRNPVVAAVWLVGTFFAVAVCYILLSATFLAAIQILVYAGAMMVLFVFVIMVLDVDERGRAEHRRPSRIARVGYYGSILVAGGFLTWVFVGTIARQFLHPGKDITDQPAFGTAQGVGRVLFREWLFPFEAISLLLLSAVIGAVVVARTRRDREKEAALSGMSADARHAAGLDGIGAGDIAPGGPTPAMDFGAPSATGHDGGA